MQFGVEDPASILYHNKYMYNNINWRPISIIRIHKPDPATPLSLFILGEELAGFKLSDLLDLNSPLIPKQTHITKNPDLNPKCASPKICLHLIRVY